MLTKNFYNVMVAEMTGRTITSGLVNHEGTTYDAYFSTSNSSTPLKMQYNLFVTSGIDNGVRIGTGTTPSTIDDYTIESQITSGISVTKPSATTVGRGDGCLIVSSTYGLTSTKTTAIVISEICLFGNCYRSSSGTEVFLIDRTVLEKPITLNPGESKMLTYTIRFNYPVE